MHVDEFRRFNEILNGMAAALAGAKLDSLVLDAYWLALKDWPLYEFEQASAQLLKTATFMPKPAQYTDLRKAADATAAEVFATLPRWLNYSPLGYTLIASTPRRIALALATIGGPDGYAMCPSEKLSYLERRFCEHYREIGDVEDTRANLTWVRELADQLRTTPKVLSHEKT
jgi:hypothetical protein